MVRKLKSKESNGGGNSKNLIKQAQEMQKKMLLVQESLKEKEIEASVGGGAVVAKVNGQKELIGIELSKDIVDPEDIEMLQDLIVSAVKEAMRQAEEMAEKEMGKVTGGLDIPGLI
ncbi:YbaB/EbfC family nucleoid-associated protein [Haliovirga abyssi]|uniref:Nucleoid-associated protein HLVA_08310 n=1 Tax=Haliovirga abyssi TaxID=2996794 RepID=A0AAU9DK59_9FUSO|nr:YbaB/EbfC family nucleoid-associated protein [Haliovirga abyssi]BDU50262.1 nucleoid-associated protein [Haliovirga abyssi]